MTALRVWYLASLALARTVASPEAISEPEPIPTGVGNAVHNHPYIVVDADGQLEIDSLEPVLMPQQHSPQRKAQVDDEDSNLRVDPREKGDDATSQEKQEYASPERPHVPERAVHVQAKQGGERPHNPVPVDDEGHLRLAVHQQQARPKKHPKLEQAPAPRGLHGFLGIGVTVVVLTSGLLIAQYIMNVATGCAKASCSADGEMDNLADGGRVSRLLPCQCSRRHQPRTVAALAAAEAKRGVKPVSRKGKPEIRDASESSMGFTDEVAYDLKIPGTMPRAKLEPCEEKEPEPEHEEESDLGPKLEGATSYVLRIVKARIEDVGSDKKSLAWQIHGKSEAPRPSRFNKDKVWDAPVDKVDLDISDPNVPVSVAVLSASDNPIEPPSPQAWATVPASLLLAEGSGGRPKASSKKETMYVHTKTIPLEPRGQIVLEYSIIAFFHWVVP